MRTLSIPKALGSFVLPAPPAPSDGIPAAPTEETPARPDERFAVDLSLSLARFTLDTKVGKLAGSFRRYAAEALVEPEYGGLKAIKVTLDMTSVELDSKKIPRFLINGFLKTDQFPTCGVRSLAVHPQPLGPAKVDVEVFSRGEKYIETVAITVERRGDGLRLTGTVHHTTPKGNKGVLDFDLLLKKVP